MSGADLVRDFRNRPHGSSSPAWRKRSLIISAAVSIAAFGSIVVRANDDSSVYAVARHYNSAVRSAVRSVPLPQVFYPAPRQVVPTSLSYAPVFHELMPSGPINGTAKPAPKGSPKAIKVSPKALSAEDFAEGYLESRTSYCVRTCDGFFFPVGTPDSSDLGAHEAACTRACPGAETAVYVAPSGSKGIEDATNRKGQRYEALATAFNHRTQYDSACSCTNASKPRNYSVLTDFTLRKGDLVMGSNGLQQFNGAERFPLRRNDFARADMSKLNAAERRNLQATEAASLRGSNSDRLSPSLKARIAEQVRLGSNSRDTAPGTQTAALRTVPGQNGRDLRYVGPDRDFDRAR
ncbi:MAG TPA: DUF2865 domain-containing protein [Beijerinckiaceae bacterium]|nr:DUF2865 domain-containing protein [Beijerinckiaceae bacterium]